MVTVPLAEVEWQAVAWLDTRRYAPQYLSSEDAHGLPWPPFAASLPVIFRGPAPPGDLEMIAAAKSLTWSDRDFNVYVGSEKRSVRSVLDLTAAQFVAIFGWHLDLARDLSRRLGCDVRITHGFNPEDTSPDAHSLASRFHTHVHVPQPRARQPVRPDALTPFDLLALVEPFAPAFYDRSAHFLRVRSKGTWQLAPAFGFQRMAFVDRGRDREATLGDLHGLLIDLHTAHRRAAAVLSDGSTESATGCARQVPRPRRDRERRMAAFIRDNSDWLTPASAAPLSYLAANLEPAEPRQSPGSTRIAGTRQLWLAKGFSGALSFRVSAARPEVRCDLAPRVVSTSGAAKIIDAGTTLVAKDRGPAGDREQRLMEGFLAAAAAAAAAIETTSATGT